MPTFCSAWPALTRKTTSALSRPSPRRVITTGREEPPTSGSITYASNCQQGLCHARLANGFRLTVRESCRHARTRRKQPEYSSSRARIVFRCCSQQEEGFQEEDFQEEDFQEEDFQEEDFQEEDFQEEDFQEEDFQEEAFQEEDFQEEGLQEEGLQEEGVQEEGLQEEGLQEEGLQEEGLQEEGFQEEGFQEEDLQEEGFQEEGLQEEGFQEEGFDQGRCRRRPGQRFVRTRSAARCHYRYGFQPAQAAA